MNQIRNRAWLIASIIVVAGCTPTTSLTSGREAFTTDLPAGCRMEGRSLQEDFEVYSALCGERSYVGIYIGNQPAPGAHGQTLKTDYAWPQYVQAWALPVPGDQARADQIANSVKLASH